MNPFLLLATAIGAEVTATLALKAAGGLTKPIPTMIVVLGYGTALWLMSTSMDMLPIGVVYAIWAGVGMIGAALGGALLFGEAVNWTMIVGIGVIALGVTILASGQVQH
ncbi:DMT family transporter [Methylobacterium brachythecii]|uniref:QacE family quaternary ammonium compound efflux SMR transporter n=1 Tax=Methylobacterium brachythecii TaxID=1176177 RepID=A0A7W6AMF3_9HYPH|nr:SMR family transporter [Methylobacterium brachythecii]MBB3905293.1 small multidrug resistance pump [Methylobacterium brachythecii]GLS45933.1 QacE family quaternary ammonium compound efflux SMR transporter [Methylobacterium brachythecii]